MLGSQSKRTEINRTGDKAEDILTKANPSVCVPRAETRLTVYRSPLVGVIKMLPQLVTRTEGISVRVIGMLPLLVGLFSVERACIKLDVSY
jgi:hypothetical protein